MTPVSARDLVRRTLRGQSSGQSREQSEAGAFPGWESVELESFVTTILMPIPDYQSLMLPVLKASAHGEVRIGAVVESLADELRLTEDERAQLLPSGKQTVFSNRVHWAKSYLSKAQLVELTRRGHFIITPLGQSVSATEPCRDRQPLS